MLTTNEDGRYTVEAPLSEQKKKKKDNSGLIIGLIIGIAAALLIALVVVLILNANPRAKVASAFKNTFENYAKGDNKLFTALNFKDIVKDKNYTIGIDGNGMVGSGVEIGMDVQLGIGKDSMQLSGDIDTGALPPISIEAILSQDQFRAHSALLNDYQFVYDYRKDNTGSEFNRLLMQLEQDGLDAESLNQLFASLYDSVINSSGETFTAEMQEAVVKKISQIPIQKVAAEKYVIDGEERRCAGYSMTVRHEDIVAIADGMDEVFEKHYGEALELDTAGATANDLIMRLRNYANQFNEITFEFFIYKKELAAIDMSSGDQSATLLLQGGDYRAQNMCLLNDGEEYCTIEGKEQNGVESVVMVTTDETYLSYDYEIASGELTLSAGNADGETGVKAQVTNDGTSFSLKVDSIDLPNGYVGGTFSVSKGVNDVTLSGNEFNLSTASSDDMADLMISIYTLIMQLAQ